MTIVSWYIVCALFFYIFRRASFLNEYEDRYLTARRRYWLTHQEGGAELFNYLTDEDHWNGYWIRWWKFWQWDDLIIVRPGIHCLLSGYYPDK